jgi:ParB family chromosome partitioning protein
MLFKQPQVTIAVSHQSGSSEWWPPPLYADMARRVMGRIDLDPASCAGANENISATQFYDVHTDGLAHDWFGRVFLNPP